MTATYFDVSRNPSTASLWVYPSTSGALTPTQFLVYPFGAQGSTGNQLLTTSYVVDMGYPRTPLGAQTKSGPSRDKRGRKVKWDD